MLCRLNHDALSELFGDRLSVFEVPKRPVRGLAGALRAFGGEIDGLTRDVVDRAIVEIRRKAIGKVFVDGSNLGRMVKGIKAGAPATRVYTFFHNVEARFFLGALRDTRSPRAAAVLAANYLAERTSVRLSDCLITLSERDSRLLRRLYGRGATHVSALSVRDKLPARPAEKFALFVGGAFYANRSGVVWFLENVAPRTQVRTRVVGRGFEGLAREVRDAVPNVTFVGEVDDLAPWYLGSQFVVAPIFDGSGMKTKVAEALMFGKKVIGTPEAFSGYEDVASRAGRICATADEFVSAMREFAAASHEPFDHELRAAYEARYSFEAARARMADIMSAGGVR
jgi:polysaccharide biosynthesis protein PslH